MPRLTPVPFFFTVTAAELEYFVKISDWWRAFNHDEARKKIVIDDNQENTNIQIVSGSHRKRPKLATISEVEVGIFSDCVVQVSGTVVDCRWQIHNL